MIEESQFIQKLDLSEPGVFVFHSSRVLPFETIQRVTVEMDTVIQKYSPESRSLFLDGCFSPMTVIKESKPSDPPRLPLSEDVWERMDQLNRDRKTNSEAKPNDRPIEELINDAKGQTKPPSLWRKAFWDTMSIAGLVVFSITCGFGLWVIIKTVFSL